MTQNQTLRCLTIALCTIAVSSLQAQRPPATTPQEVKIGPSFEVATVRPARTTTYYGFSVTPSGRVTATEPLNNLVVIAYNQNHTANILPGPKWDAPEPYEINAKVDDAEMAGWDKLSDTERYERVLPMLRALLNERFHLKLGVEMRDTPVVALVQARSGAKLKEVSAEELQTRKTRQQEAPAQKPAPGAMARTGDTWTGNAVPLANLVGLLGAVSGADRLVIDQTGLKGAYDFTFHMPNGQDGATAAELIERDLGLKLVPQKIPMKTYIILSSDKPSLDEAAPSPVPAK